MLQRACSQFSVGIIVALAWLLGVCPAFGQQTYSRAELREIFSKDASVTFSGDIRVSTYDYELDGKKVQALLFRPPGDEKKPALLLVPGYRRTAIDYVRVGLGFARAGYVGLAVTQPGFGGSEGPSDWVGPTTIKTMEAGLSRLAKEEFVDASRLGIYGFSRGALAASLLVVRPGVDVKAVIACSGVYDFKKAYDAYADEGLQAGIKANMRVETGLTPEAIDARTSVDKMDRLTASMLVVHGRKDVNVPVDQAEALIRQLETLEKDHESRIYDDASHGLGGTDYFEVCLDFLRRKLED
jgi:dipeptidyl aminopeptidase/acylaminoacyl peptidase